MHDDNEGLPFEPDRNLFDALSSGRRAMTTMRLFYSAKSADDCWSGWICSS
jgi:hypothetical protein